MLPLQHEYLATLRRTQWLAPEKLIDYQGRLLSDLALHAYQAVPFYRDRLAPLFRRGACDLRAWHEVPILNRGEIDEHAKAMRALSMPPQSGVPVEGRTSGTTGASLHFIQSEVANLASQCLYERTLEVHQIDRTAHHARIRLEPAGSADYPEGREDSEWNLACPTARLSRLGIHTSIAEQAEWLKRRSPAYLTTYPSTLAALTSQIESAGEALALQGVLTVGESFDPHLRQNVDRMFGCSIFDNYGATEIGYIAFQCPAEGGYHVCSEFVLVELIDESGNEVPAGQPGRVVLTSFYNFAMPFIRYAIGDYAVAATGPCRCGRTLPRLKEILGRQRNVFTFSDGSQYSPWKWRRIFRPHVQAKQFQIVQTAIDRIEIRYVPLDGASEPDQVTIERIGRAAVHRSVVCRAVQVVEIPRLPSGKIEDCISLVPPLRSSAVKDRTSLIEC